MKKTCSRCKIEKSTNDFSKSKTKKDGLSYVCKDCQNLYTSQHYIDNKQKYIDKSNRRAKVARDFISQYKLDKSCPYCGESDPACLDFHHKNPEEKTCVIASMANYGYAIERIEIEISKCILLCSNCHRKLHVGRLNIHS